MQTSPRKPSDLEENIRISPGPVLAALTAVTFGLVILTGRMSFTFHGASLLPARIALYLLVIAGWLALLYNQRLAKWILALGLSAFLLYCGLTLELPELYSLLFLPVALTSAFFAPLLALPLALFLSAALLVIGLQAAAGLQTAQLVIAGMAIWCAFGLSAAISRPLLDTSAWILDLYHQALAMRNEFDSTRLELNQALEDLLHTNRQLTLANEKQLSFRTMAEEAQKTKAAFVAKVSHEFRTPLNMIIGLVNLMIDSPQIYGRSLPKAMVDDLKIIQRNCDHLTSMINDVLALSQAESGRLALHREYVNLEEIIQQALEVVQPLVKKKGLETSYHIPADLEQIYCDRTRIRQVLLNLASNATRFTEEGGVYVEVDDQGAALQISVRDTGPGIASEDVEKIFDPFCQGNSNQPWVDRGGTGLGLTISKQFIELHGGRIWVESQLGAGSTFFFSLPKDQTGPVMMPARWINERWNWISRSGKPRFNAEALMKPRLVVLDPERALDEILASYHNALDYRQVDTLAEVLQDLRQEPANLVLVNVGETETLEMTLAEASRLVKDTPVVGSAFSKQSISLASRGVVRSLVKPITRADLVDAIADLSQPVRHVLLVDNDLEIISLYSRMLENNRLVERVSCASNGTDGLRLMREERPDLILLDLSLPDMDGLAILDQKNQDEATRDIPVIIVSALDLKAAPLQTRLVMATMGDGLGPTRLLDCAIGPSDILIKPGGILDPVPV